MIGFNFFIAIIHDIGSCLKFQKIIKNVNSLDTIVVSGFCYRGGVFLNPSLFIPWKRFTENKKGRLIESVLIIFKTFSVIEKQWNIEILVIRVFTLGTMHL